MLEQFDALLQQLFVLGLFFVGLNEFVDPHKLVEVVCDEAKLNRPLLSINLAEILLLLITQMLIQIMNLQNAANNVILNQLIRVAEQQQTQSHHHHHSISHVPDLVAMH